MGTATVTVEKQTTEGRNRVTYGTLAGSASYATNGETLTASALGMGVIEDLIVKPHVAGKALKWSGSKTAPKLIISVADVEVANASNQTTATGSFRAVGTG